MTKVFNLKMGTPLPSQKQLLTVTANKVQLIEFIVEYLINRKDDVTKFPLILTGGDPIPMKIYREQVIPQYYLETHQEEADVIIIHQVISLKILV